MVIDQAPVTLHSKKVAEASGALQLLPPGAVSEGADIAAPLPKPFNWLGMCTKSRQRVPEFEEGKSPDKSGCTIM